MGRHFPYFLGFFLLILASTSALAQDEGQFSGQLQVNANFFDEDAAIGATNTPQYDHQLFGSDVWLDLSYQYKGFDLGIRADMFTNSNLLNPTGSYSDQGLGKWYVRKQIADFTFQVGYIYDQFGSGLIFRSYEQRPLLIDNALVGISIAYDLSDRWQVKALAGRQKNLFDRYESNMKGLSVEGYVPFGSEGQFSLVPGGAIVGRTWSDNQVDQLINSVNTYTPVDSIGLFYNTYAFTFYNTLSIGPVSWYIESAFKTQDVYFDADASRLLYSGETTLGKFRNDDGNILYTSLSYGSAGLGISAEYKRTENFTFRASPFASLNRGLVNFLPPMSRINSFRLKSRYIPATQELSEQAIQAEVRLALSRKLKWVQYFSYIENLNGRVLYREWDTEFTFKKGREYQVILGLQSQRYNQAVFEGKSGVPMVETWIPYFEYSKRLPGRKSIRVEGQYMFTQQDFGSWAFLLLEYNIAPKWSFSVSDMYNAAPEKTSDIHYPRVDLTHIRGANRFSLSYVKQVEGVVCAGGICRLEPAFSGVKFGLTSTF